MPLTAASAIVLSTDFSVSLAASTTDFCVRKEVEKVARGALRVTARNAVVDTRDVRNDMTVIT